MRVSGGTVDSILGYGSNTVQAHKQAFKHSTAAKHGNQSKATLILIQTKVNLAG